MTRHLLSYVKFRKTNSRYSVIELLAMAEESIIKSRVEDAMAKPHNPHTWAANGVARFTDEHQGEDYDSVPVIEWSRNISV